MDEHGLRLSSQTSSLSLLLSSNNFGCVTIFILELGLLLFGGRLGCCFYIMFDGTRLQLKKKKKNKGANIC